MKNNTSIFYSLHKTKEVELMPKSSSLDIQLAFVGCLYDVLKFDIFLKNYNDDLNV